MMSDDRPRGDAALRPRLARPGDPPDPATETLRAVLAARAPGLAWQITPLPFVVDRWAFFEATLLEGSEVPTERYVVDVTRGVVPPGEARVLGEIFGTLDVLGAGRTSATTLARLASCLAGSPGQVLDEAALPFPGAPPGLHPPRWERHAAGGRLAYCELAGARHPRFTRWELELAADYGVAWRQTPLGPS
ncbi:MAG: hypothetical protein RBU45_24985 [Myxococcota bacterium]|jgi:hypothetical protein|nr:hypothetical protein [Myxococcota bacterium]